MIRCTEYIHPGVLGWKRLTEVRPGWRFHSLCGHRHAEGLGVEAWSKLEQRTTLTRWSPWARFLRTHFCSRSRTVGVGGSGLFLAAGGCCAKFSSLNTKSVSLLVRLRVYALMLCSHHMKITVIHFYLLHMKASYLRPGRLKVCKNPGWYEHVF